MLPYGSSVSRWPLAARYALCSSSSVAPPLNAAATATWPRTARACAPRMHRISYVVFTAREKSRWFRKRGSLIVGCVAAPAPRAARSAAEPMATQRAPLPESLRASASRFRDADVEVLRPVTGRVARRLVPVVLDLLVDEHRSLARNEPQERAGRLRQRHPSFEVRLDAERVRLVVAEHHALVAGDRRPRRRTPLLAARRRAVDRGSTGGRRTRWRAVPRAPRSMRTAGRGSTG